MKILQVVSDTDRRGAQVFATDLEAPLRSRGLDVDTVALVPGSTGGLDVEVLASRWPGARVVSALRARMAGVDMTVAHGSTTGPACALAGMGAGRPFVYRQISDSRFWAPTRAKRTRVRITLARARFVVALSEFNRDELIDWIGLRADRIAVVPNGVPGDRFTPGAAAGRDEARAALGLGLGREPIVLCIGALVPEKGVDLAIRALGAVSGAHLVVAGAGPEHLALEWLAAAVAPGRVHFVGSRPDAAPLYRSADVLVLPSRGGDAMPGVLIEAGLAGLPAVSTRIGAIPDVLVDGATGLLVPPDDERAVTRALERLLGDRSLRERMGRAARSHCLAHFEIERVADGWAEVLTRAVGGR